LEEENQVYPLRCVAPKPSQRSEKFTDGGSPKKRKGERLGMDEAPNVIPPLEEIISVVREGNSRATNHPTVEPEGEKAGSEDLLIGSTCPVMGKPPSEDMEV